MVEADVVAVASPLYFGGVPAQLKALIDLGQCYWLRKYVECRPLPPSAGGHATRKGVFISTGGQDGQDFSGAVQTIQSFFDVYDIEYWAELLHGGVDGKAQIREEPLALQEAHDLGFRAVAEAWE
jgi:multimeric flavodoxin WrbA